jgi:sulfide:quinone oxidoreductase
MNATSTQKHFKVLILGGGSGGISVAARLAKKLPANSMGIIEPSEKHFYQPLWTLVGAGIVKKEESCRKEIDFIPNGTVWIKEGVAKVYPEKKEVRLSSGSIVGYDFLVIATGLSVDYRKIKGLEGSLGKNGICSVYDFDEAGRTGEIIQSFRGGHAIFTMPPVPIKCAGAPQKIMYLADGVFRNNGVRDKSRITFASAGKVIFGIPEFAKTLNEVVKRKEIETLFSHRLVEVVPDEKTAVFEVTTEKETGSEVSLAALKYDLLHVVPPMSAHSFVKESGLAVDSGPQKDWLEVDQYTLQHKRFPDIFGVGDVTGIPNSKTGAAIRKQAPIVVQNLLSVMKGEQPLLRYDGYSSCPLVTDVGKVILAEFGYDGKLMPSFPIDPTKERRSMWYLKRYFLPKMYWMGMLRGKM